MGGAFAGPGYRWKRRRDGERLIVGESASRVLSLSGLACATAMSNPRTFVPVSRRSKSWMP